eukprot:7387706-Prymnesium_polylepis.1
MRGLIGSRRVPSGNGRAIHVASRLPLGRKRIAQDRTAALACLPPQFTSPLTACKVDHSSPITERCLAKRPRRRTSSPWSRTRPRRPRRRSSRRCSSSK